MSSEYCGGCLCGSIRFEAKRPLNQAHSCSCSMCRRHTGSLTAVWLEFLTEDVKWIGPAGEPARYRSSDTSQRAFCANCGSSIGAIDDAGTIGLLTGAFDDPGEPIMRPTHHSFRDMAPEWWQALQPSKSEQ